MRQNLLKKLFQILFLTLLTVNLGIAQVTTSSVQGSVIDQGGEALIGATLRATHEPSGSVYGAITNLDGRFNLANLRVGGPYSIQISYLGFENQVYTGINLRLGEPYSLNVVLSDAGTQLEEFVITGERGSDFTSNRTGTATNITNEQLNNLPQINRSVLEFTRLTPQANGNSFAGRDARYNNLQIDGANFNNGFGLSSNPLPGGNSQPISLDAIQEITVNIAPYDVLQSGFTGAGINAVTRSGTNTFQGSAYGFLKNQDLQGRRIADNELPAVEAATRNYGFRLGGPIIKNKLFFFVNAEREEQTGANASGVNLWRPSENGISDPENNIARTTRSDLEAVQNHLVNQWGYDPGRYEGYANEASQGSTKLLARVDWNINEKNKLAVRYNQVVGTSNQLANGTSGPRPRTPFPAGTRVGLNSITFENGNFGFENSVRSITAELNSYLNSKWSNQFLATYTRIQDRRVSPSDQLFPFVDIWDGGDPVLNLEGEVVTDANGNPVLTNGDINYMSFGTELFTFNNDVINNNYSFINNLNYVEGRHNVTMGAAFEIQNFGNSFTRMGTSYYRYRSVEEFLTTGTPDEVAPTLFGLTYPYAGQETYATVNFGLASLYIQDRYSVNNNLTLTYGLRGELPIYMNELTPNPSINAMTLSNQFGMPTNYDSGQWPKSRLLVSPRFGFNYDVFGDRSLTIRGGSGAFSGRVPFVWLTNMPSNSGVIQNTIEPGDYSDVAGWIGNIRFQPERYYYVENVPQGGENVFISSPNAGTPGSFALVDRDFKMPMVWRSSLGVDYLIPNTPILITGDFLYTRDINAVFQFGANRVRSNNTMDYGSSTQEGDYGDTREIFLPGQSTAFNRSLGGNNATVLNNTSIKGHSFSGTVGLSVPNYKGLSASLYYTYSAAMEVTANSGSSASSAWGASPIINSPNDQMLHISSFAIPHRIVGSMSYRIEYAKALSTTFGLFYSGSHQDRFSYSYSNDLNGDGITADLIYLPNSSQDLSFNPISSGGEVIYTAEQQRSAFDSYVSENGLDKYRGEYLPRNAFLSPWLNQVDLRVLQDLFTEIGNTKNTLQLSVDIVNLGNLINREWGIQQQLNGAQNLLSRVGSVSASPNLNLNRVSGELPVSPFRNGSNFNTTWSMQLGLRYIF